jgi:hypothetical protein
MRRHSREIGFGMGVVQYHLELPKVIVLLEINLMILECRIRVSAVQVNIF